MRPFFLLDAAVGFIRITTIITIGFCHLDPGGKTSYADILRRSALTGLVDT